VRGLTPEGKAGKQGMGLRFLTTMAVMAAAAAASAQVPEYRVYCDPDDYAYMVENYEEEIEIPCTVQVGDTLYAGALIRLRGDSSRGYPKKSYRITFADGQPLAGRTEWNFNGEYLDPTYMHAWLYSWIMGRLDYPCFDVDHAEMYVNDTYMGLYVRLEPVDEQFLSDRGMDPDGNLYKAAVDGACLSRYDDVPAWWEKKANESENWTDLYGLIDWLDGADPDQLHQTIGQVFDMDRLMTILAVNALTMNYSTYYHNYYVYRDIRGTGLWTMLAWDVDKLWGDWVTRPYTRSVNNFWHDNPLLEKVVLNPVLTQAFFARVDAVAGSLLTSGLITPVIDSLETAITPSVEADTCDDLTPAEFHDAVASMRDSVVQARVEALDGMYAEEPRSFRAHCGDTVSLGEKFVSWEACYDPSSPDVQYHLLLYTEEGWPLDTCRFVQLEDTCWTFEDLDPGSYVWKVEGGGGYWWRYAEGYDRYNPFTVLDSWSELSGTLEGHTVLDAEGSPYYVSGDLLVPESATLQVNAGVELRFASGAGLECLGRIECLGSAADSVSFRPDNVSQPWAGVGLQGADASFFHTSFSGSAGFGSSGACLRSVDSDLTLNGCSFLNNMRCVSVQGGTVEMDSCDLTGDNRGELFFMESGESASITASLFGNMTRSPWSSQDGIEFQECLSGEYTVSGCHVFNIDGDCIDLNSSSVTAVGNRVEDSTDKGFSIGVGSGGGQPSEAVLEGNVITGCPMGVAVKDDSYAEIASCTISGCDIGVRTYTKTSGFGPGEALVLNTILHGNGETFSFEDGSSTEVSYSLTGAWEPWQGEGNIAGDPLFAEWDPGDYRLSWESPCIDAGSPELTDPDGTRSDMGAVFFPQVLDGLVINELQSLNDTTIADAYGEYDDWLELYNGSGYDCDLSWAFLSQDPLLPETYRFPPGTVVPAEGFLLVWADGHPWQDGCHLPFRISAEGDSLYLWRRPAEGGSAASPAALASDPVLVDSRSFGPVPADRSLGRTTDGGEQWGLLASPTPGWSNSGGTPGERLLLLSCAYPNPARFGAVSVDVTVDAGQTELLVYDLSGRLVEVAFQGHLPAGEHTLVWDARGEDGRRMPTGLYLLCARHAGGVSETGKVVVLRR